MPTQAEEKRQAAREVIDILHEISTLLVSHMGSSFWFEIQAKANPGPIERTHVLIVPNCPSVYLLSRTVSIRMLWWWVGLLVSWSGLDILIQFSYAGGH